METSTFIIIATFLAVFSQQYASAVIDVTVDPEGEVCPGTSVTFTCSLPDNGLVWEYNGSSQSFTTAGEEDTVGPFMVNVTESNGTFISSTATATAMGALNGTVITCIIPPNVDSQGGTVSVTAPPSFVPKLTVSESSRVGANCDFNLEWNVSLVDCNLEYVITVDSIQLPDVNCTAVCTTQCRKFTLGRNDTRRFTAIAQNCDGAQNGTESDPLQVYFELPDAPMINDPVDLTYANGNLIDNGQLVTIQFTWEPVPDPDVLTCGVNGSITGYSVSVTGMDPESRTRSELSHMVNISDDNVEVEYEVSVATEDMLGLGDAAPVGTFARMKQYVTTKVNGSAADCYLEVECVVAVITSSTVTLDGMEEPLNCSSNTPLQLPVNLTRLNHNYIVGGSVPGVTFSITGAFSVTGQCETDDDDDEGDEDDESDDDDATAIALGAGVGGAVAVAAVVGIIALLVYFCCPLAFIAYCCCCLKRNKEARSSGEDRVELKSPTTGDAPEAVVVETGALYQDPGEIKREEFPGTHDEYALPDKKRKTHKPEDHQPTYADPKGIEHAEAPETGELYTVVDKRPSQKKKKRAPSPPTEEAPTYSEVDMDKKHKGKELNYSELQMFPGGPAPPPQNVEYSTVQS